MIFSFELYISVYVYYLLQVAGQGPSVGELRERINSQEVNAAHQAGSDLIRFGISEEQQQPELNLTSSGCKPPAKKPKDLFTPRFNVAMKKEMKIRHTKASASTKLFKVANSDRGKIAYEVILATTPSCTCTDFQKLRSKVLCKHILFVVLAALDEPGLQHALKSRYLTQDDVTRLITKPILDECVQIKKKRSRYVYNI